MMDGTPARLEMFVCMMVVSRPREANSFRYMAAETPMGKEKTAVRARSQMEPHKADLMPACSGNLDGKLFKKSQLRAPSPRLKMSASSSNSTTMATKGARSET